MKEYLELIFLITLVILTARQAYANSELDDQLRSVKFQLDDIEKQLKKLQPKQEPKIPVRLSDETLEEVLPVLSEEELEQELKKLRYDRYMRENKAAANKK
jgi:uncharacterized alpha-E superfamily protein